MMMMMMTMVNKILLFSDVTPCGFANTILEFGKISCLRCLCQFSLVFIGSLVRYAWTVEIVNLVVKKSSKTLLSTNKHGFAYSRTPLIEPRIPCNNTNNNNNNNI
jgi:hypothetical protein